MNLPGDYLKMGNKSSSRKRIEAIKEITAQIRSVAAILSNHDFLPEPPLVAQSTFEVSWQNRSPGISKQREYVEIYKELLKHRQFTFAVGRITFDDTDDVAMLDQDSVEALDDTPGPGLFQFYYAFKNEAISKARLAFYPEGGRYKTFFRIDLDRDVSQTPRHSYCHLQIGAIEELRIPLVKLPTPRIFVEFCLRHFYSDIWNLTRDQLLGDTAKIEKLFVDNSFCQGIFADAERVKKSWLKSMFNL